MDGSSCLLGTNLRLFQDGKRMDREKRVPQGERSEGFRKFHTEEEKKEKKRLNAAEWRLKNPRPR